MSQRRSLLSLLAVYVVVIGTLLTCVGVGFVIVVGTTAGLSDETVPKKTLLGLRIESSREIRDALAKPVARPEPLLPITAKLARPLGSAIAVGAGRLRQRKEALDAFASSDLSVQSPAMSFDRHAPQ